MRAWRAGATVAAVDKVSCTGRDFCVAAGDDGYAIGDGTGWTPGRFATGVGERTEATDVTCVKVRDCMVTGATFTGSPGAPVTETLWARRFADGNWSGQASQGWRSGNWARRASCGASTACLGVDGASEPVQLYAGTCPPRVVCGSAGWQPTAPVPPPTGTRIRELTAVSCTPTWCMVVGRGEKEGRPVPVASRWTF